MQGRQHPIYPRIPRVYAKEAGQSIPLIALMLVILIGLVALSVDVGNTYGKQREVIRATNAAATVAMQTYIEGGTDGEIYADMEAAFLENNILPVDYNEADSELAGQQRRVGAYYLDAEGNRIVACPIGTCSEVPAGVAYIEVETDGLVDTYFARVVGQDQLAVKTEAFASMCPPINGVYPIGVNVEALGNTAEDPPQFGPLYDGQNVRPNYNVYLPDLGAVYSVQKLFFDGNGEGDTSASFVRWRSEYNGEADLVEMFDGAGNLRLGFEEVPEWPEASTENPDQPYPVSPGYMTRGDWMYGYEGDTDQYTIEAGSPIGEKLEFLRNNRTQMILPIYRARVAEDPDPVITGALAHHIVRFGVFYLYDFGIEDGKRYIELAFHSIDPVIPCDAENVLLPPDSKFGLDGDVHITPYIEDQPEEYRPAAYTIMLDVSGSMMWNFDGVGLFSIDNRYYQCEAKRLDSDYTYIGDTKYRQCSSKAAWPTQDQRRVAVAREAIRSIAMQMNDDERMRIIAFSSNPAIKATSSEWFDNTGQLSDGSDLENHILTVGQCGSLFKSCGGTSGPDAMDKAKELITAGDFPFEEDEFGNVLNDKPLRPVVLYMTDGVANKMRGTGETSWNPACQHIGNKINTAFCQIGENSDGETLPISSMQEITQEMKDAMEARGEDNFILYVLAMGRLDLTGLDRVASGGVDTLFAAREAADVQLLLERIKNEVSAGVCTVELKEDVRRVTSSNRPSEWALDTLNISAEDRALYGDDIYGYVTITGNNIDPIRLPIHHNDDGVLVVEREQELGLVPGEYAMSAKLWYNASGESDGTQFYDRMYDHSTGQKVETIPFTVTPMLGSHFRLPDIHMDLRDEYVHGMCQ
jgi:hypothetical protein